MPPLNLSCFKIETSMMGSSTTGPSASHDNSMTFRSDGYEQLLDRLWIMIVYLFTSCFQICRDGGSSGHVSRSSEAGSNLGDNFSRSRRDSFSSRGCFREVQRVTSVQHAR